MPDPKDVARAAQNPDPTIERESARDAAQDPQEQAPPESPAEQPDDGMRLWNDATGTYHLRARFRGMAFGTVRLEREDGVVITLPMEQLSAEDQQWIKARGRQ